MTRWFNPSRTPGRCPRPKRPLARYRYVRLRWRVLFAAVDAVGWLVVSLAKLIRRASGWWEESQQDDSPRSILLVQLDHLGDAILSTGFVAALGEAYPRARLDVLASDSNAELFRACDSIDRVYVSRINRLSRGRRRGWIVSMLFWGWRLRRNRYDLAIDVRGEFPVAIMLWLSGARRRLGWGCAGGGFLLTRRPRYVWGRHEVLSREALLAELNINSSGETLARPRLEVGPQWRNWAAEQLRFRDEQRGLAVLHCGAGTQAKTWPVERWRELVGRLLVEHNAQIILVGGNRDIATAETILGERDWPGVIDLTGRLSLMQLAAMLQQADVLVGADSGPAHLAAAVGTPVVALFSGTNRAEQWRPWGPRVTVLRHGVRCAPCHNEQCPLLDHPCMSGLQAADVATAVAGWLPRTSPPPVAPPRLTELLPSAGERSAIAERTFS
jgi:heptosyltransferase-2